MSVHTNAYTKAYTPPSDTCPYAHVCTPFMHRSIQVGAYTHVDAHVDTHVDTLTGQLDPCGASK